VACEVMRAVAAIGIDVPGQLSLVGFDDELVASLMMLALTTLLPQQG
jgi:DNA-binding LacI/PurR family transcriptional regulator